MVGDVLSPMQCEAAAGQIELNKPGAGGSRKLLQEEWCRDMARQLRTNPALAHIIGPDLVAVQCTYFEKSATRNWLVPLHQDVSIPVAARVDDASLSGWSCKEGAWYVRAPLPVLEKLIAVRVHLDPCGPDDGPLRVVPGSHLHAVVSDAAAVALRDDIGEVTCLVPQGAVLVMRPLLLHASSKGGGAGRRRVLHFVFGPRALPAPLEWHSAV